MVGDRARWCSRVRVVPTHPSVQSVADLVGEANTFLARTPRLRRQVDDKMLAQLDLLKNGGYLSCVELR